jgi:hypothetical protein
MTSYAFDDDEDNDNDNMALTAAVASSGGGELVNSSVADDFDYADADELEGSNEIIASLTKEEEASFPDEFMALRHYRAEKVGTSATTISSYGGERSSLSICTSTTQSNHLRAI